jgi:hypothetical protein
VTALFSVGQASRVANVVIFYFYEMIYLGLHEFNNIPHHAKFQDLHFGGWHSTCFDPCLPREVSFLNCYQLWLRSNYPVSNGEAGALGGIDEGVVRYGPNNNTAWMVTTCHKNACALYDTVKNVFSEEGN